MNYYIDYLQIIRIVNPGPGIEQPSKKKLRDSTPYSKQESITKILKLLLRRKLHHPHYLPDNNQAQANTTPF